MAPFLYEPLNISLHEIRLLHLSPGKAEDDIEFRIVHVPLPPPIASYGENRKPEIDSLGSLVSWPWTVEEIEGGDVVVFNVVSGETHPIMTGATPPERTSEHEACYEALLYTWGDAMISENGYIRNEEDTSKPCMTLGLRPNLTLALRNLRHSDETRVLWIDAICINQDDIQERNEQVKRMTSIYTMAKRVIIWLGEEADNSKHALHTLQHIGRQLNVTKSGRIIAAHDAVEPQWWRNDHSLPFDQSTWQGVMNLVERAWFYRVWCWQEVKLGSSHAYLQCGSEGIPWRKFWMAICCINNKDSLPSTRFRERCRHIVFLDYQSAGHSLSNILDISRSKGCADPKDKIYGLLGMTARYFSSSIVVDYSQPLRYVYKDAFIAHLNHTKRLELLKHCDSGNHRTGGPSWVPDWSMTEFAAPVLSEQLSSGISRAWFTYREPEILEVVGKHYTTIKTISRVASKVEEKTLLAVSEWFQCLPDKGSYITGETMEAAFALTLCMNRTKERHPYSHFMSTSQWLGMLHGILCLSDASQNDAIYSERETANTIQKLRGRRFVTTESGHIGTAPAGARVGK